MASFDKGVGAKDNKLAVNLGGAAILGRCCRCSRDGLSLRWVQE